MVNQKRKTLSDLTNTHNLIPTSTLRKLVAAATAGSGSNSFSKPLISALRSNSSSTNHKLCSESSNRSETSIGSSNVSVTGNSRTVQFRTPPRAASSVTSLGGLGSKDVAHNQRQIIEKSKKRKEAPPTSVEKRQDTQKDIAVPFSSSLPQKLDSNQNEVCSRATPHKRKKRKDEANISPFGGLDMMKDSDEGVRSSYYGSYGKTGIGKAILKSSGCAMRKEEGKLKGISNHPSCSIVKTSDRKKGIMNGYGSSALKIKDVEKEFVSPSSFLVERTKSKGEPVDPFNYSFEKAKDKGKAILQPSYIVAGRISCLPPRSRSEKWKNDPGASSSCPPTTRTKNIPNDIYKAIPDIYEAGDFKISKSWADPHLICRKKRCSEIESSSELPLDFTAQQREYIKEVDGTIIYRPPMTRSEKLKNDAAASSSCLPMTRTKNIQNDTDAAKKFKSSKSWTDPHPKCRKKRYSEKESSSDLPLDFIEKQRAYFKEVDDFELPEEEASEDEQD